MLSWMKAEIIACTNRLASEVLVNSFSCILCSLVLYADPEGHDWEYTIHLIHCTFVIDQQGELAHKPNTTFTKIAQRSYMSEGKVDFPSRVLLKSG